jgi:hypothetical protein
VVPDGKDVSGYYDDLQYIAREHAVNNSTTTDNYLDNLMHGRPPMHERGSVASSDLQSQRASGPDPRLFHSYDSGTSGYCQGGGGGGDFMRNQHERSTRRTVSHMQTQTPPLQPPPQPQYNLEQNSQFYNTEGERVAVLQTQSKEFERRALTAEMKCDLLTRQIQSMPASLSVSLAEKRVLECKLNKTLIAHDLAIQQIEADNVRFLTESVLFFQRTSFPQHLCCFLFRQLHQIRELQAFLKLEVSHVFVPLCCIHLLETDHS